MEATNPLVIAKAELITELRKHYEGKRIYCRAELDICKETLRMTDGTAARNALHDLASNTMMTLASIPPTLPAPPNYNLGSLVHTFVSYADLIYGAQGYKDFGAIQPLLASFPAKGRVKGERVEKVVDAIVELASAGKRVSDLVLPLVMVDDEVLMKHLWPLMSWLTRLAVALGVHVYGTSWLVLLDPVSPDLIPLKEGAKLNETVDEAKIRGEYQEELIKVFGKHDAGMP